MAHPCALMQVSAVLEAAGDFQNAYLAASLARLGEAASAAFPGSSRALPTAADLQRTIARVHEELKAASGDRQRVDGCRDAAFGRTVTHRMLRALLQLGAPPCPHHQCPNRSRPPLNQQLGYCPAPLNGTSEPLGPPHGAPSPQARPAWPCWWLPRWARPWA